jgi:hypothetical protein
MRTHRCFWDDRMNLVKRFKQYGRQNALVSADLFDDSDWHRCLVVAGVSSSLGAYGRCLLIFLMLLPIAPQVGLRAIGDIVHMNTDHLLQAREHASAGMTSRL